MSEKFYVKKSKLKNRNHYWAISQEGPCCELNWCRPSAELGNQSAPNGKSAKRAWYSGSLSISIVAKNLTTAL